MVDSDPVFNDVVCGLLVRSGRILLVHRNGTRLWAPNSWDAPGGHIEQGESDFEALAREVREELGIAVAPGEARLLGRLSGSDYDARVFAVDSWSGEPENRAPKEHDDLAWFPEEQLCDLVLADPDLLEFIVGALRHEQGRVLEQGSS